MKVLESFVQDKNIKFTNFKFTTLFGEQKIVSLFKDKFDIQDLKKGASFDGSSVKGWKTIENSDTLLKPDFSKFFIEPYDNKSLTIFCDVIDTKNNDFYSLDPRNIAKKSEIFLLSLDIADKVFCGPELEFFIFDNINYSTEPLNSFYKIKSDECSDNECNVNYSGFNRFKKDSYMSSNIQDCFYNLRQEILLNLAEIPNLQPTIHHHEVGVGQSEIGFKYSSLVDSADNVQIAKHVIKQTAKFNNKTATFMPKIFKDDAGSGMHCHFSLFKEGRNLFHGDVYENLSELALYFIGGISKHIRAICAFTNPTVNSYKRLKPGFEAPVLMSYSKANRSTSIRIPYSDRNSPSETRIECRFPDGTSNPYLTFSSILMAGIDGIINKIHPGDPTDTDLFSIDQSKTRNFTKLPVSLIEAVDALEEDNLFLQRGGVFSEEMLNSYIKIKKDEWNLISSHINPIEFSFYYNS